MSLCHQVLAFQCQALQESSASLLVLENLVDLLNGETEESEKKALELAQQYDLDVDALNVAIEIVKG